MRVAGSALRLPYRVTVMVVAPAITWLLVTTSPVGGDDHPGALVLLDATAPPPKIDCEAGSGDLASMETTAGSTLSMTDSMLVVPLRRAGPAEISFTVVDPPPLFDGGHDPAADQRADQRRGQ